MAAEQRNQVETEDREQLRCRICNRQLTPEEELETRLCQACLAEEESCGCSDD